MNIKLTGRTLEAWAVFLYCLYFEFHQLIQQVAGYNSIKIILGLAAFFCVFSQLYYKRWNTKESIWWIGFFLLVTIGNQALAAGKITEYTNYVTWIIIGIFLTSSHAGICKNIVNTLLKMGMIHVSATILFFLIPPLYTSFYNVLRIDLQSWATILSYQSGYELGLTSHYSTNAIYCTIAFIIAMTLFINCDKKNKERRIYFVFAALAMLAILLTAKRGHLIFGLAAVLVTYYFCAREHFSNKILKTVLVSILAVSAFMIVSQYIPALRNVIERFVNSNDDISNGRYAFWEAALDGFYNNKIFGLGWQGYFYVILNADTSFGHTNVHNVYIQLLCERGIVGTAFVILLYLHNLKSSLRCINNLKKQTKTNYFSYVAVSFAIQVFFIIYGITGCDLFDFTFVSYVLSCCIFSSINMEFDSRKGLLTSGISQP